MKTSSQETWSGYHAGVSLTKKAKDINFDLDLMYGNFKKSKCKIES